MEETIKENETSEQTMTALFGAAATVQDTILDRVDLEKKDGQCARRTYCATYFVGVVPDEFAAGLDMRCGEECYPRKTNVPRFEEHILDEDVR